MNHRQRAKELVAQMTTGEKIHQLVHNAPAIKRLCVEDYNWWNEALHGVGRAGVATVFPQAIGLAATFDEQLMRQVATVISDEVRAMHHEFARHGDRDIYKGLTCWSPNINIFRDPRWGRGHETYGEDPFLTAQMAIQFIQGMQGEDPNYRKVDATPKHLAAHSGPEGIRHGFNSVVSQKDLYETYLYAFERCVKEAKPAAVMGAYNAVNGEPSCASKTLLQDILRDEWGFEGYVVSDCGAICDINEFHRLTGTMAESAALALNNGCDLNCGRAYSALVVAVEAGMISEETLTQACERLFEARFRLGMFDDEANNPYAHIPYETVNSPEHRALALKAAQESLVLLKNDGLLPLEENSVSSIAVIGPNADEKSVLEGNYNGTAYPYVTLIEGIRRRAPHASLRYVEGCKATKLTDPQILTPYTEAVLAAERADVVVLCLGLNPRLEGEEGDAFNSDAGGDKLSLFLPEVQQGLYRALKATGKPLVVVNVSGSAIALNEMEEGANALVQMFYPGEEGGTALAGLLFGDFSPCGRLPVTFYASDSDLPDFADYSMRGRTYRYFEGKPLYPFGYGLSYTTFAYENVRLSAQTVQEGEDVTLFVTVTNTGSRAGAEVVQVYLSNRNADCPVPRLRLAGLRHIDLAPGQAAQVEITIPAKELLYFNLEGKRTYAPGEIRLFVGGGQPQADEMGLSLELK